jgi:thiamine-phosphate pyrophosphorylase
LKIPHDIHRILDANANRAREALRVMEEYVRFVQNDPAGNALLKQCRHDLAEAMKLFNADDLLTARDTPGDVGTQITTSSETRRSTTEDVFTASAKRLTEALRALEEYGKLVSTDAAARFEALRYRAYDIEQRVRLRGDRSARFARVCLYVIITESLCTADWLTTATRVLAGGADCLQLREKDLDDGELLARARQLTALCREHGAMFIMNDRPDLARLAGADGVHVGQTDMSVADARRILGPDRLIGVSTHNPAQLADALTAAPDYVAVGPMYDSATKPQPHVPGPDLLQQALARTEIPIVAIGGITPARAGDLAAIGATCLCICSAVISQKDPEQAARSLKKQMSRSRDAASTVS